MGPRIVAETRARESDEYAGATFVMTARLLTRPVLSPLSASHGPSKGGFGAAKDTQVTDFDPAPGRRSKRPASGPSVATTMVSASRVSPPCRRMWEPSMAITRQPKRSVPGASPAASCSATAPIPRAGTVASPWARQRNTNRQNAASAESDRSSVMPPNHGRKKPSMKSDEKPWRRRSSMNGAPEGRPSSASDWRETRDLKIARRKRSVIRPGGPKRPRAPLIGRRQGSHNVVDRPFRNTIAPGAKNLRSRALRSRAAFTSGYSVSNT